MELPKESQVVEYKRKWRDVARPILIRVPKPRFSSKYSDDLALPITNSRRLGLRWEPFGNEDELRGHELLRFLKSRMDIRWEERPRPEANLDDIDRSIQGVRQVRQTGDTGRRFA